MVKIITDTTSCLSDAFSQQHNIPIIPQIINFGNESYYEGIQLSNKEFMQRLRSSSEIPKTAAPPPELFVREFERLTPLEEPILCIHPSSEVSGTVRSATIAAQEFPQADIRIIDSRVIGSPLASMVLLADEWAQAGETADQIEAKLRSMIHRSRVYFLVSTLEYLQRGGRIGGAQALLGSILQIKPILCINDGQVDRFESERTHKRAVIRLKEIVKEQFPGSQPGYLAVMHAGVPDEAQSLASDLSQHVGQDDVPIYDVPPAIVTHGGPGILAVSFFVDTDVRG